jgi:Peptidase family S41
MQRRDVLSLLAAAPLAAGAQPTPTDLASDVALVREVLQTLHPGLLRYNTPEQLEGNLASLEREFVAAADLAQRYLALQRFLSTLQCGHSYANMFNQSQAVRSALFERKTRLPFAFTWIGNEMVVASDHSGSGRLAPGTVVRRVNGEGAERMLAALLPYTRADGRNPAKRRDLLSVRSGFRFEYFDCFHGLVFGEPPEGVHRLEVRTPDGREARLELPALTLAERHAFAPSPQGRDEPVWQWRVEQGVALLTMPGWALFNSRWDWKAWLEQHLDSLAGPAAPKGLVVDLRGNEGGLDCGDPILERFLREPNDLPMQRLVRYRKTPTHLNRVLDTWDDSFRDWGDRARPVDERFFALPAADTTLRPRGARLAQRLVVLIGSTNSSATFAFAQRVRAGRLGTLVGETTGGNQRGINGGAFFFVRLPASGLEFDQPLIGTFPPRPMPDAGIEPDVAASLSATDIAERRDPPLQRAMALARG